MSFRSGSGVSVMWVLGALLLTGAAACGSAVGKNTDGGGSLDSPSVGADVAPSDHGSTVIGDTASSTDVPSDGAATGVVDATPTTDTTGPTTDRPSNIDTAGSGSDVHAADSGAVGPDTALARDATSTDTGGTTDGGPGDATSGTDAPLAAGSLAVRFADSIITRWPDPGTIGGKAYGWDYNIGIVLTGMQKVYERTGDAKYLTYIRKYIDTHVDVNGAVDIPAGTPHSLDLIQPAGLLLFLYQQTSAAKYSTAAAAIRTRFDSFPKNADGGYWHKQSYPNEMWLDGIYMAEPFLVRYGRMFSSCGAFCDDTPVAQIALLAGHVLQSGSGLAVHAWDQDKNALWANPATGNSPEVWVRGFGWFAMALVDILGQLPATHAGRASLMTLFATVAGGIRNTQDPSTGLWFQVVDKGTRTDNWVETSGSGMFVYALKVGVDRGYLDSSFLTVAQKGYAGLKTKVTNDAGGLPVINEAVQGMSVQVDYASYVAQARLSNSVHGLCSILMAASQMD